MPAIGQHRRGVPQDRHLHVLHPRGAQVLDELFPGLLEQMTAHGAVRGDTTGTGRWQLSGNRFRQENSGISGVLASRPFLEGHVRAALGELPEVTLVPGHDIVGLIATDDRRRVTGVRLAPHGATAPTETLPADLVVDATGRGSRTPRWLAELGYPTPTEDRLEIGLGYASRTYRLRPGALGATTASSPERPECPARRRAGRRRGRPVHPHGVRHPRGPPADRPGRVRGLRRHPGLPRHHPGAEGRPAAGRPGRDPVPGERPPPLRAAAELPAAAAGHRRRRVLVQPRLRARHDRRRARGPRPASTTDRRRRAAAALLPRTSPA